MRIMAPSHMCHRMFPLGQVQEGGLVLQNTGIDRDCLGLGQKQNASGKPRHTDSTDGSSALLPKRSQGLIC